MQQMNINKLLDKLNIDNRELLLEFLVTYSRIEYALKRSSFITIDNGDAKANWEKFISDNKTKLNVNKNKILKEAIEYLLSSPAQKQIIKDGQLGFTEHPSTKNGPKLFRIYHCIRITRNNLFHGGKFPDKPMQDLSRDKELIKNCLIVLKEIIGFDKKVENIFWEINKR